MNESKNPRKDGLASGAKERAQVVKGAGLTGVGAVLEGILRYVSMLLVTRFYGQAAYGVFGFAMYLNEMGQRVSSAGLHDGVMRYVAIHEGRGETDQTRGAICLATKIILGIGIIFAVALALFAPQAAEMLAKDRMHDVPKEMVIRVIRISCLALPTTAFLMLLGRTLRALKQIGAQVLVKSFVLPITRVSLLCLFLWVLGPDNLAGLIWAIVISTAFACALALYYVHKTVRLWGKDAPSSIDKKEFLGFALPLVGVDIAAFFSLTADVWLLAKLGTQVDMGTYQAVLRLIPLLAIPLFLFSSMLTPLSAELYGQGKMQELRDLYRTSVRWIYSMAIPLVIGLCLFIDPLLSTLGEGFLAGHDAFLLLAAILILNGFANPAGYAVTMAGRSKVTLFNACIMIVVVSTTAWFAIPAWGVLGAAVARATGILVNSILTLAQGWWILGLNPWHRQLWKPTIAGLLSAATAWTIVQNNFADGFLGAAIAGVGVLVTYLGAILLLGLTEEDKELLRKTPLMKS
jgi:O-antigen/teichoic acid export membrane protein